MSMTPRQDASGVSRTPVRVDPTPRDPIDRHRVADYEVIVIDKHTAESLGRARPNDNPTPSDAEMFHAEEKTPDGAGANPHERLVWPRVMAILGIAGLLGVGGLMYAFGDWNAAAVGVTWLALGYAVSWIVVWAAGVFRAKDEHEIAVQLDQRHRQG